MSVAYTACASYDSLYGILATHVYNALGQTTTLNYTDDAGNPNNPDAHNGWGQWLTTKSDANSQVMAFAYDALGRVTATALPGDTLSTPTTSNSYPVNCPKTTSAEPCYALTTTQQLASGVTFTSATYYDGWGRAVETVAPQNTSGSTTTWTVSYTEYDGSGRKSFVSDPYFVTSSSTTPAYARPDTTQPGTSYTYDGLGRVTLTKDPLHYTTTTTYTVDQPMAGANITDTAYYEVTTVVDANNHKGRSLTDGLGLTRYVEQFSGNGGGVAYALYGTSRSDYDWLGAVTATYAPTAYPSTAAGLSTTTQTTTSYDLLGRAQSMTDADLGTVTTTYDANGNVTSTVDPRGGSSGTTYTGYDGLNRVVWRNTANSPSGAYASYTYDQTGAGYGDGIGRLTTTTFTNGNVGGALNGSDTYDYDGRGQQLAVTQTMEGTAYTFQTVYNDAGQPTSQVYSDNETLTYGYNGDGWLTSLITTPYNGSPSNLLTNITYSGWAGASGKPTGADVANGEYTYATHYDADLRLTNANLTHAALTFYALARSYDGVSNVTGVSTTLYNNQTDNQAFCYDEQNQLTWASSATTSSTPCGGSNTAGSLTSAIYTQAFAYDATGRLTSSPTGSYTYGDSAHVHAATVIAGSTTYTAAYDSAGDMTCRATTSATTCAGTQTGAPLTYDNERRMTHWQNAPGTSPTAHADFLYDGSGQRVEQQSTSGGPSLDTAYLFGGIEEVTSGGVVTKYLGVAGLPQAIRVGTSGSLNYLAADSLGSVSEAVDGSLNVVAAQLYAPYGQTRYTSGTMPTAKGFTGQRADATSGLDDYGARYYDPLAQQFTEADTANDGLSRFAYVKGNPETAADPSGHRAEPFGSYLCCSIGNFVTAASAVVALALQTRAVGILAGTQRAVVPALDYQHNLEYYRMRNQGSSAEDLVNYAVQSYKDGYLTTAAKAGGKTAQEADAAASLMERGGGLLRAARWLGIVGLAIGAGIDAYSSYNEWLQQHPGDAGGAAKFATEHAVLSTTLSVVGAWAGGVIGAAVGGAIGSVLPGPGTVIGGYIGGFAGSAIGGYLGGAAGDYLVDASNNVNDPSNPIASASSSVAGWLSGL